jgi:hypothetical protein
MFVITADQIDSRHHPDLVPDTIAGLNRRHEASLLLPFERTAGDEIQGLTDKPATALAIVLELTRTSEWSVGCGVGTVREPLPDSVRAASGRAFIRAREAVGGAKKAAYRFTLARDISRERRGGPALIDPAPILELLLAIRSRRTLESWQLYDLLAAGLTQAEAAQRLDIPVSALSGRVRSAGIRTEFAALPQLERLLADVDAATEDAPA